MDCRAETLTPVPLPADVLVAVMDTGTRRVLADVAYADRRGACGRAARDLGIAALRDATVDQLASIPDPVDRARAHHVLTENLRTLAAAEAMRCDDPAELGRLMNESHASLRDEFDVSAPALDAIVDAACGAPGCFGARMTGGGFAGCAVAIVRSDDADAFATTVIDRYRFDGHTAHVWGCDAAAGASVIDSVRQR
jgi:galactokinase